MTNGQTVKAIAIQNGVSSSVASELYATTGVTSTTVTLMDYEDHTWTYYSDKPDTDYPDALRSPDPRNVKITYQGGSVANASSVAVSATESQNTFVYYKTIEKQAWGNSEGRWLTGNYAYKVIPNPFSKRPRTNNSTGTNGFYGFAGWEIVSGGEYINGHNNQDVLALEEKINFVFNDANYTPNCTSAEIVFKATWTPATVVTVNGDVSGAQNLTDGGTYETNFVVVSGTGCTVSGMTRNATITGCYPDGTGATGARLGTVTGSGYDLKIENINIGNGGNDYTANTGWLIVGRGCTGNVRRVLGNTGQIKMRIESGLYNFIHPMSANNAGSNSNYGLIIFGNDYDRANNDGLTSNDQYVDNSSHRNLRVINYVSLNGDYADKADDDDRSEYMDITIKSGYYGFSADYSLYKTSGADANNQDGLGLGMGGNTDNTGSYTTVDINGVSRTYTSLDEVNTTDYRWQKIMSFYCGRTRGGAYGGINRVLVEGGELGSINGGGYQNNTIGYHFRMKGGWVKGAVYGTASASVTDVDTKQVITGGEINGWIAGACNGTDIDYAAGNNNGNTYIYLGGRAELRSHRRDGVYNNVWGYVGGVEGGSIYASGRGTQANAAHPDRTYCGSSESTYAVVADEAQVERNVCGGGYIGVAQNSHIYILGGTISGAVYGGAMTPTTTSTTWRAQTTDIRQYGGTVEGGIYGGHYEGTDNAGKIHQTTSILILGGQVGTSSTAANVHGGGFGSGTSVGGDVSVTLGTCSATSGATVYGDVYGGSALGSVNTSSSNTTTVSLYKGTIYGGLYGGGLGDKASLGTGHSDVAAVVNGAVAVKVYGGSVLCSTNDPVGEAGTGSVFGCNNINGAPQSTVTVDIYGTDPAPDANSYALHAVYGGGNKAPYTRTPVVTIHGCNNSIDYVYGGGNATDVLGTDVTIYGGHIGNAFGGGNGYSVTGNHTDASADHYNPGANITNAGTLLNIYGGTIGSAFGGSNQYGTINSTITVNVEAQTETGSDPCSGTAYTACAMEIDELYGGGNEAAIQTSSGGWITPTMNLDCSAKIGMLFGGAKKANYVGNINLVVNGGTYEKVFGGNNLGGTITGNVTVTFNGGYAREVYGGCNQDGEITGSITVNIDSSANNCNPHFYVENVYGGGNEAQYGSSESDRGNYPQVNVVNGTVRQSVYGGGFGAEAIVYGSPVVTIGGTAGVAAANPKYVNVLGNVFGGGNAAPITGSTSVTVLKTSKVGQHVFGGGNAAAVSANTFVHIKDKARIYGNIYGGGNQGTVGGDTKVIVNSD